MKKAMLFLLFSTLCGMVFAQLPTVGVLPFEISGQGPSAADAQLVTTLLIEELTSWETMVILTGDQAENAGYIVRGQISMVNNQIVLTATTSDGRTGRELTSSRATGATVRAISMEAFSEQITRQVPIPNFLLGTWRSTIDMIDGPVTTILEFRTDRSVVVHRFDTWEHNGTNILKYQAIGTGTYTYVGRRRTVTLEGRQILSDATVGITLTLEDALPRYTSINVTGLRLLFNANRDNFELVYGVIPCGNNFSGPLVYPSEEVFYTRFTKIQ